MRISTKLGDNLKQFVDENEYKDNVNEILFLLLNCKYNLERFMYYVEENNKLEKDVKIKLESGIGKKIVDASLPSRFPSFYLLTEFYQFLGNVIRCLNFIVKLKLMYKDSWDVEKIKNSRTSIGDYCSNRTQGDLKKGDLHKLLILEWPNWIKDINSKRGDITHSRIDLSAKGMAIIQSNEGQFKSKLGYIIGGVVNAEDYMKSMMNNLNELVTKFFEEANK